MQHKVILLAAQRHKIEPECLSGGSCRDTAISLLRQYGVRRRQMAECNLVVSIDRFSRHIGAAEKSIEQRSAPGSSLAIDNPDVLSPQVFDPAYHLRISRSHDETFFPSGERDDSHVAIGELPAYDGKVKLGTLRILKMGSGNVNLSLF